MYNYVLQDEMSEFSLNGTVYDFSVDFTLIWKEYVLNIHDYLMIKNNTRQCLVLLSKCLFFYQILADQ